MAKINIKTAQKVVPMIYAYSTPEISRHNGWVKIGYTEKKTTKRRQNEQVSQVDTELVEEWKGNAIFEDGSGEVFSDHDFHAYLQKLGVERLRDKETGRYKEWFHIGGQESQQRFFEFRANRGILGKLDEVTPYTLRKEQNEAVDRTVDYFHCHEQGEFLWNAKPRFGKTLSVYDFCLRVDATNVLIVTNRPAIANSWYSDYVRFLGRDSGYFFVSRVDGIKDKPYVVQYEDYKKTVDNNGMNHRYKMIYFVSLQDLKGAEDFNPEGIPKLKEIARTNWDILVVDEAHEGIMTDKTDVAFDHIKRKFTLHLSGTPFKMLASDTFPEQAIFNWTYADEQRAKDEWNGEGENPYKDLPKLNMFTYQMSEIIKEELEQGVEIQGETEEFAFNLNDFFATNANGNFIHNEAVDRFLDALTTQEKFPFSTPELRDELKHTFWILDRVDSAKALARKLRKHPIFQSPNYEIVIAAGDGKLDEEDDQYETEKSFDKVKNAINKYDKTITLSVGQLTTGVTIPEWTAVLILANWKTPSQYMQAAFRAQNPCLFSNNGQHYRKENAYVFDFDPARTLNIYEKFANDLIPETSDGRGNAGDREDNIRNLLNFFPVIGEDEDGEMVELDAAKVLSIPRKIRSEEVVRRGFMSDFLFQNISNVFHAPQTVIEIIQKFTAIQEPKGIVNINSETSEELSLDEKGDVNLSDEYVIGKSAGLFGDKIFEDIPDKINDVIDDIQSSKANQIDEDLERMKSMFHEEAVSVLMNSAGEKYGSEMRPSDKNRLERKLKADSDRIVNKAFGDFSITEKQLEREQLEKLAECETNEEIKSVNQEYTAKKQENVAALKQKLHDSVDDFVQSAGQDIVRTVETQKKEQEKKAIEDSVKDHLRGFTRTIPSFLMAYGDNTVTLATFDRVVPGEVFLEVTSITLDQFRFLRDGGYYTNEETGKQELFRGHLFDDVVFNDSVREFLRLRVKLANYFEETSIEDIFDYIPPQKTNQIFTPKWVVKKMVDMLEEENPGCFDMPDKTFIDMYMKSGLYITEIVKRLFQSEKMKQLYPDKEKRLKHIFKEQVYGLAPTEIIYKIATNYILGFDETVAIEEHNFRQADALEYAKNGTLEQFLDELYGE